VLIVPPALRLPVAVACLWRSGRVRSWSEEKTRSATGRVLTVKR